MSAFIGEGEARGWEKKEVYGSTIESDIADNIYKMTLPDLLKIKDEVSRLIKQQKLN